jgi:hypothetical protein
MESHFLDFNWGVFWAILAVFALRGIWRDTIGQSIARHNEEVRRRKSMSLDD